MSSSRAGGYSGRTGKGAARLVRSIKRDEAEVRAFRTVHENTKHHRVTGVVVFGNGIGGGVRVCSNCPE